MLCLFFCEESREGDDVGVDGLLVALLAVSVARHVYSWFLVVVLGVLGYRWDEKGYLRVWR